ncbi:hypothetical protein HNP37_001996 [Flavobacterium nitrogenifigens]|uniref:MoxR-vWA-beta-propeller ternary system domain-containing protein n=2 Tax=Flavobacterium TaxID=237 RepID=A0A7W7N6L2_9FLAO|nr:MULTISPECIES: hypothetical protein [Flavobacterium]MBB4801935.1 hypothetical protein [Flavobacterium nitrogenifigens]MBB6386893.1 hypothetical protein [Flavobacterium notoginsengisoli]
MYFLEINKEHKEFLGAIRHWENLKVAFESDVIWVKDFSFAQISSPEMLQIPYTKLYELKENLLFEKDKLLPLKKLPSGLLWTPILRALPILLPKFNHNFFGINQKVKMTLKPSENTREAYALLVDCEELKTYIESAPKYRLEPLRWIVFDKKALIIGTPLLPLKGDTYWFENNFLMPSGYDFEWNALTKIMQKKLNPTEENIVLWNTDNTYFNIPIINFKPLSISSFRLTFS